MKISQRLDYNRFAEVLNELGVIETATLQHILQQSFNTGELFPEVLVREGLIADWELSRIACEAFHMVFLSVDFYQPSPSVADLFDRKLLHQHCVVPLDRYEDLVTVAMPALTPSEVLTQLGEQIDRVIQPVVGTAASNRRWLTENLPLASPVDEVSGALPGASDDDWGSVFDEGDAAVLMELKTEDGEELEQELQQELESSEPAPADDAGDNLDGLIS